MHARRLAGRRIAMVAAAMSAGLMGVSPLAGQRVLEVGPDTPLGVSGATSSGSLQRALADAGESAILRLAPGHYWLDGSAYTDATCGNCEDASESVPATLGLRVSGDAISIQGAHRDSVIIHTRAGYGILFEDCANCALSGVTVTDGIRDADGRATNAGVVARRSSVVLRDCAIRDNIGDSAVVMKTVVGIAGIAGREQSHITVERCHITRNSWDGIALYRDAHAEIRDNIVDGVDKAAGARVGGGRGVGIGLTWNAEAVIEGNLVKRYWKGIGAFVEADAVIRENIVEDILTWGIALWGPNGAMPTARIESNVIYRTGACGVMLDRPDGGDTPGTLIDNVVARTGQNERYDAGEPYCWQRPVARHHVPAGFVERGILLWDNRQPREAGAAPPPLPELARETLLTRARTLTSRLAQRPALAGALLFSELPELGRTR